MPQKIKIPYPNIFEVKHRKPMLQSGHGTKLNRDRLVFFSFLH
jgi:hypothetical protein